MTIYAPSAVSAANATARAIPAAIRRAPVAGSHTAAGVSGNARLAEFDEALLMFKPFLRP